MAKGCRRLSSFLLAGLNHCPSKSQTGEKELFEGLCDQLMDGSFHTTQKPWSDF